MTPERFGRIAGLYHEALSLAPGERASFLDRACAGDEALRNEIGELLAADADAGSFLDGPAIRDVAAHVTAGPTLSPGTSIGPYDVQALLGRGGMGEVYRARDPRLGRDVAIKLLPQHFAPDAARVGRLEREARLLAALNHPNIASLYGIEEWHNQRVLVMELVEGVPLDLHLASGPIPLRAALAIAEQLVDGLEAAHERGVIHRDLKPANITIRPDGTVKILDFGLAKVLVASGESSPDPTVTDEHTIVGTASYMSPEQARGATVDARTDIWAFACVLYEMLTGRRPFRGETSSDVIAAILDRAPDWDALSPDTPAALRRLLRRCLEKDSRDRLRHIADARLEIRDAETSGDAARAVASPPPRWRLMVVAAAAAALVTAAAAWIFVSFNAAPAPRVTRFSIAANTGLNGYGRSLALSPDGSRLAYLTAGPASVAGLAYDPGQLLPNVLAIRSRDRVDAQTLQLPVDVAGAPFFSPDGEWIGFTNGQMLYKLPATGGSPVPIADVGQAAIACWADEGIVAASARGLLRVSPDGGTPESFRMPPLAETEQPAYPQWLPGGRAVLFTVIPVRTHTVGSAATLPGTRIEVLNLATGTRKTIVRDGGRGQYVKTGHLVYEAAGSLYAVPFDLKRLEARGDPQQVVGDIDLGEFAVANDGTLAYMSGGTESLATLVWVDRNGREEGLDTPPGRYAYARLSPDGTRVALDIPGPPDRDIWIWDVRRRALERFTIDPSDNPIGVWSPDGTRMAFGSNRLGRTQMFVQRADRSDEPKRLLDSDRLEMPISFAPDGRLLFSEEMPNQHRDIQLVPIDGSAPVQSLVHSPGNDATAEVSPDDHWLAYDSNESGQFEVYVRPFPDTDRARWQISVGGGRQPLWSRDGREVFYRDYSGALLSVPVARSPTLSAGPPRRILDGGIYKGAGASMTARTYDLSLDGRRFLMLKLVPGRAASITVVLNWTEELKRRVPVR